ASVNNQILNNVIAGNSTRGVEIDAGASNMAVLGNSIFANGPNTPGNESGLGIDLNGDGVTHNDLVRNDPENGGNHLQKFPELTSVTSAGGSTTIDGTLNSIANTVFRIEFFANDAPDPS